MTWCCLEEEAIVRIRLEREGGFDWKDRNTRELQQSYSRAHVCRGKEIGRGQQKRPHAVVCCVMCRNIRNRLSEQHNQSVIEAGHAIKQDG